MSYKWPLMQDTITKYDRRRMSRFIRHSDRFTNGEKVREFEQAWSDWLGCERSLFVSSGSTANFLLLASIKESLKLKAGDKVLVPSCTWMTNVAPVIQLGLTPIFCDIELENYSFDGEHLENISKRHPDIKLIFVTHLLGLPGVDHHSLFKLFPNAVTIDDACESHGVMQNGVKVGTNGAGATFSFYFGHHMTTVEGGMVSTNNLELYDLMKMKRSHGMARESVNPQFYTEKYPDIDPSFLFITDGYNFRNHEVPAVLGLSQLERLDEMIDIRKNNYKVFIDILSNKSQLFYIPSDTEGNSSFCFPLVAKNKDTYKKLKRELSLHSIEYRPVVSGNLLDHPFLAGYELDPFDGRPWNVDIVQKQGLYVGNNHFVGDQEMSMLDEVVNKL